MTSSKESRAVIWRLSDGKAGHDAQSRGLADAFARLVPCELCSIPVNPIALSLTDYIKRRFRAGEGYPDPDIIIAAGHGTHVPALQSKRARGGSTVVLMKPSLPLSLFDYCLIPKHDHPPTRENVLVTTGVLNTVQSGNRHDPGQGLVLIGGPSRHYGWNHDQLIRQLQQIISQQPNMRWTITDSPRTPASTLIRIRELGWANTTLLPCGDCGTSTLQDLYAGAGIIWVTEDSVSMVYESLTSGARTGLLQVPRKRESRVSLAIENLVTEGMLVAFDAWQETNILPAPVYMLDEANRCAKILLQRGILKQGPVNVVG